MVKILSYTMPVKDPTDPIRSSTVEARENKILLLLGMIAASYKSVSVPNIDLSVEIMLKMNLRKARGKYGKLKIFKLSGFELHQVRFFL